MSKPKNPEIITRAEALKALAEGKFIRCQRWEGYLRLDAAGRIVDEDGHTHDWNDVVNDGFYVNPEPVEGLAVLLDDKSMQTLKAWLTENNYEITPCIHTV